MRKETKAKYKFYLALNAKFKTTGIVLDPLYFEHCVKTFFGISEEMQGDRDCIGMFAEEVFLAVKNIKDHGLVDFYGRDFYLDKLTNETVHDPKQLVAADFIVKSMTGRSREEWLADIKKGRLTDYQDYLEESQG